MYQAWNIRIKFEVLSTT